MQLALADEGRRHASRPIQLMSSSLTDGRSSLERRVRQPLSAFALKTCVGAVEKRTLK